MNTLLEQPSYLEECKKMEIEVRNDYENHHYKKGVGGLIGIIKYQYEKFQRRRIKDKADDVCKCSRCKAKNQLFKLHWVAKTTKPN